MTAIADNKKRLSTNTAKPGHRFDVQVSADGKVILTPLVVKTHEVPIVKMIRNKDGFLLFPPGKAPDRAAIRAAIREDRDKHQ